MQKHKKNNDTNRNDSWRLFTFQRTSSQAAEKHQDFLWYWIQPRNHSGDNTTFVFTDERDAPTFHSRRNSKYKECSLPKNPRFSLRARLKSEFCFLQPAAKIRFLDNSQHYEVPEKQWLTSDGWTERSRPLLPSIRNSSHPRLHISS